VEGSGRGLLSWNSRVWPQKKAWQTQSWSRSPWRQSSYDLHTVDFGDYCLWRLCHHFPCIGNTLNPCIGNTLNMTSVLIELYETVELNEERQIKSYSNSHQIACLRPRKDFTPSPYRVARSQQCSAARFASLRILSCLHLPGFRWFCFNVVRFCGDLEAFSLVTDTTGRVLPLKIWRHACESQQQILKY
jgi:hypothetical protein